MSTYCMHCTCTVPFHPHVTFRKLTSLGHFMSEDTEAQMMTQQSLDPFHDVIPTAFPSDWESGAYCLIFALVPGKPLSSEPDGPPEAHEAVAWMPQSFGHEALEAHRGTKRGGGTGAWSSGSSVRTARAAPLSSESWRAAWLQEGAAQPGQSLALRSVA